MARQKAKQDKHPIEPYTEEQVKNVYCIYTIDCYQAIKMYKLEFCV